MLTLLTLIVLIPSSVFVLLLLLGKVIVDAEHAKINKERPW